MNLRFFRNTALIAIALLFVTLSTAVANGISWNTDLGTAVSQAKELNKPILLDMYTDWCGWCKKLDSDVYPDPNVVQAADQFVAVRMNAETDGKEIAAHFNVRGYPDLLFLSPSGKVLGRIDGYTDAKSLASALNQTAQDYQNAPTTEEPSVSSPRIPRYTAKKKPATVSQTINLASSLLRHKKYTEAAALIQQLEQGGCYAKLGGLYNDFGDLYQKKGQGNAATIWYTRTTQFSNNPGQLAYAHLQLAKCYAKVKQLDYEQEQLALITNAPDSPVKYKTAALAMLKKIH